MGRRDVAMSRRSATPDCTALCERLIAGHRPSIARAISTVERGGAASHALLEQLHPRTGAAYRIGVTGAPGAGKSTLLCAFVRHLRSRNRTVGIIAVDPTSPFTQGAVLGDRIRMSAIDAGDGVFIRSMASRGETGGLSARTQDAADVLDAAGFDYVLIESVGVGQVGLDVEKLVDTTIVVVVPESGDQVQAIKAGLMEIADVYVVNKCDRPGSGGVANALQSALGFQHHHSPGWSPRVLRAVAVTGEGIEAMAAEIERHREYLQDSSLREARRRQRVESRTASMVAALLQETLWSESAKRQLAAAVDEILAGRSSPHRAAQEILERRLRAMNEHD